MQPNSWSMDKGVEKYLEDILRAIVLWRCVKKRSCHCGHDPQSHTIQGSRDARSLRPPGEDEIAGQARKDTEDEPIE